MCLCPSHTPLNNNTTVLQYTESLQDTGLAALSMANPRLQRLFLNSGPCLTDEGMRHVGTMTALRLLHMSSCNGITSTGLTHLRGLTRLEHLRLRFMEGCKDEQAVASIVSPSLLILGVLRCGISSEAAARRLAEIRRDCGL